MSCVIDLTPQWIPFFVSPGKRIGQKIYLLDIHAKTNTSFWKVKNRIIKNNEIERKLFVQNHTKAVRFLKLWIMSVSWIQKKSVEGESQTIAVQRKKRS